MKSSTVRVMRVITRLNVGGPSYQAIFLTERLQDQKFETRLLAGSVGPNEGSMEPLAAERGVTVNRVPGLGREISLRSDALTVVRLTREMRHFRPQIVHTHLAKAGTVGRLAACFARVPRVVHTYHGHVFHGYFSKRKTDLFLTIERLLARCTDRIVVLGEAQEREILGYGVGRPEQMVRIPLGLELGRFLNAEEQRGKLRRQLGLPPGVPLVGIVARLVPIKAHSLFLKAAQQVAQSQPNTQFLVIGDGDLREDLEQQALALGLRVFSYGPDRLCIPRVPEPDLSRGRLGRRATDGSAAVHFLGFRTDLPAVYADLDAVVLCSLNEGLPVTIIEALAAARPVVTTDVGAVRDLVQHCRTGLIVPPGDVPALSTAILEQLLDPESSARMGAAGRTHVHPRFSVERLEQDIRGLYRELVGQPRPVRIPLVEEREHESSGDGRSRLYRLAFGYRSGDARDHGPHP